jgi:hypothetical protein
LANYTRGSTTTLLWPGSGPKASYCDKMSMNVARQKIKHYCSIEGGPPVHIHYTWQRLVTGIHVFADGKTRRIAGRSLDVPSRSEGDHRDPPASVCAPRSVPGSAVPEPPASLNGRATQAAEPVLPAAPPPKLEHRL